MRSQGLNVIGCGLFIAALRIAPASAGPPATIDGLLTTTCAAGGKYEGSFHAAVAYKTLLEEPKRKTKLQLQCKSGPAAAYVYEYGDATTAGSQAAFLGAKLWGGAGPTAEHSDELLSSGGTLIVLSGPGTKELADVLIKQRSFVPYRGTERAGSSAPSASPQDVVLTGTEDSAALARAFASALNCGSGDDPLRVWCSVAEIGTAAFVAPKDVQALSGMSVVLPRGTSIRAALLKNLRFSVLALSAKQAFLQELRPENAEERQEILGGLMAVTSALKLGGAVAPLSAGLAGEVKNLRAGLAQKGHPLKDEGKRATYTAQTPSEVYFVDSKRRAYVVIERAPDGLFVSLFPAANTP